MEKKIYFMYFWHPAYSYSFSLLPQFEFWWMGISLCSASCPRTCDFSVLVAQVLGLQVCTITHAVLPSVLCVPMYETVLAHLFCLLHSNPHCNSVHGRNNFLHSHWLFGSTSILHTSINATWKILVHTFILYEWMFCFMYVCSLHVSRAPRNLEKSVIPPETGVKIVISFYMGAGN